MPYLSPEQIDFIKHTSFFTQLEQNNFSTTEIFELLQTAKIIKYPANQTIIKQDEMAKFVYFILEGICNASYLTPQGKQFSKEFYWEQDWIIGFEGIIKQKISPFMIETINSTQLLCLPIASLQQWREQSHPLYIKLLETQLMYKENKERFMLLHAPAERYALFCRDFPDLLKRLNDYQIAAYLGITHISLSRIKARIRK